MGEYHIAANKTVRRRVVAARTMSLPKSLQKEESLYDKYMPRNRHHLTRSLSSSSESTSSLSSLPAIQGDEFNKRYLFWKDEHSLGDSTETIMTSNIVKIEKETSKETDTSSVFSSSVPPVVQRFVTYSTMETTVSYNTSLNDSGTMAPREEHILILSSLNHCLLTGTKFKGTYYAFLMSHKVSGKKKDTNIGVSRYPIFSVIAHNNQARHNAEAAAKGVHYFPVIYDKDTASAAPFWRLNTTLGPFFTKRAGEECCHEWVKKTRGTTSKQDKAYVLASAYRKNLYTSQNGINMSIERYLYENNAPPQYIREAQSLKTECRIIVQ